jgi:hypothetical protein
MFFIIQIVQLNAELAHSIYIKNLYYITCHVLEQVFEMISRWQIFLTPGERKRV